MPAVSAMSSTMTSPVTVVRNRRADAASALLKSRPHQRVTQRDAADTARSSCTASSKSSMRNSALSSSPVAYGSPRATSAVQGVEELGLRRGLVHVHAAPVGFVEEFGLRHVAKVDLAGSLLHV